MRGDGVADLIHAMLDRGPVRMLRRDDPNLVQVHLHSPPSRTPHQPPSRPQMHHHPALRAPAPPHLHAVLRVGARAHGTGRGPSRPVLHGNCALAVKGGARSRYEVDDWPAAASAGLHAAR